MASSGGPTVGLDIGSHLIKVAEARPGKGGVVITALGLAPTPAGVLENNVIVDPAALGQEVKKLLRTAGVSTKRVVSSVSGQSALVVRVIEVPKMSPSELADTMKWEVERHVPFAASEVIMDFQAIERPDEPEDAQNMEVLLAVAQQDMIDRHVAMLFAAGLKPVAIDVEPLSAARALIDAEGEATASQRNVVILNIGASNTDIGVYRGGILAFPRTLPLAGDSLTKAISDTMGVDAEEAEKLKRENAEIFMDQIQAPGATTAAEEGFLDFSGTGPQPPATTPQPPQRMPFDLSDSAEEQQPAHEGQPDITGRHSFDLSAGGEETPAPAPSAPPATTSGQLTETPSHVGDTQRDPVKQQVFNAIAPVLGEFVTEIRRSLEYYRGRVANNTIDEILVCGGTAKLPHLDEFLSSELGIPTRVANPLRFAAVSSKAFSQEYLDEVAALFPVAVGLAERDLVAAGNGSSKSKGKSKGGGK